MWIWIVVLGTSAWAAYDASENKIPIDKKPYSWNNGALAWLLSCLLLWIFLFPYYLVRRSRELSARKSTQLAAESDERNSSARNTGGIVDLERLAKLRADGVITEEEFAKKKQQILGLS